MSVFPKYDRYKDSGVEWLGEAVEPPELRQRLAAAATKLKAAHD